MSESHQLSELQLDVMRVLWDAGEAKVAEVRQALAKERGLALTTVATLLSRLEKRKLVAHRLEGRQFVYQATVSQEDVRVSMVSDLAERLFQGDLTAIVSHLLTDKEITKGDLSRVKALIEAKEEELGGTHGVE